jgi:hypothetical protein
MFDNAHEVYVLCNCGDILHCRLERYISDVRIVEAEAKHWRDIARELMVTFMECLSGQPSSH